MARPFKICPDCGAHLDASEPCDCKDAIEREPPKPRERLKLLAVCREVDKESGRVSVYPLDLEITSEILTGLKMRAQFNPELRYFTTTTARWDRYGEVMAGILKRRTVSRADLENIGGSGYGNYGASHTKKSLAGWLYGGGSAKEDIQDNLSTLRQRCRDLYMGVPLATGALKTCRTNVIGSGLRLKSQIDYEALGMDEEAARDLERKIEREFSLWADSTACDLERLDNFYELQQLAFLNWLMSGDVIATLPVTKRANMPYDLRICLIEADRLSNPNGIVDPHIIGGVETNDAGEVVAYQITKVHPEAGEIVLYLEMLTE